MNPLAITAMSDDELHARFCDEARYHEHARAGWRYQIRIGRKLLHASDTAVLFDQLTEAVRKMRRKGKNS